MSTPEIKFDTKLQVLKYKVLREVARSAWQERLLEDIADIPEVIVSGKVPTMRCCVYKERAILRERIKLAMGGDQANPNVIEVISMACDECPAAGYEVSDACRGCLAHRCADACRRGAITFDRNHVAHIDKEKCVDCGQCAKACQFTAIINHKRPCQNSCKAKAISISDDGICRIDDEKCVQCGSCVYHCPFGAISDKSYILNVIDIILGKGLRSNKEKGKIFAIVAPAMAAQFSYAKPGQVVSAIKELGFTDVVEAALGADMVALSEAKELAEKGFLTSSCCPAFVKYVKNNFPELEKDISHNLSPMATLGKYLKENNEHAKVVFIGPCTAKKAEAQLASVKPYVDVVITFEELQALIDSRDIDVKALPETPLDNASYYGRIFAHTGGLSQAVAKALEEQKIDFKAECAVCSGLEECRTALLKKSKNVLKADFIEGMACEGGCVEGAGNLVHYERAGNEVDKFASGSAAESITSAVNSAKGEKNG